jgi:alkylation response protein AidB-like acyl-CoA dehydrogenase
MLTEVSYVRRARAAAEVIAPLSARIERERSLPPEAVGALVGAGVYKMLVPLAFGGGEAPAATLLEVIEELARADGSAGWCAMIGATSALMSAYLEPELAREVYGPADAITCGSFAPLGRAELVEGGYRVRGRWPFASGCEHASWRMGGVLVGAGGPGGAAGRAPEPRSVLFRADETKIFDTWHVSGLCGTGSHDFEVAERVVPATRVFSLFGPPKQPGALYRLPLFGLLAAGVAMVSLGLARRAIDVFTELAGAKRPPGSKQPIAHRELVQLHLAQAEAKARSARAFLFDALGRVVDEVDAGDAASLRSRALLRLAAAHAAAEAAAAVDLVYHAGGASSVYAESPLQRCFRDVHVATQHVMVSPTSTTLAGRVLLGLESDVTTL